MMAIRRIDRRRAHPRLGPRTPLPRLQDDQVQRGLPLEPPAGWTEPTMVRNRTGGSGPKNVASTQSRSRIGGFPNRTTRRDSAHVLSAHLSASKRVPSRWGHKTNPEGEGSWRATGFAAAQASSELFEDARSRDGGQPGPPGRRSARAGRPRGPRATEGPRRSRRAIRRFRAGRSRHANSATPDLPSRRGDARHPRGSVAASRRLSGFLGFVRWLIAGPYRPRRSMSPSEPLEIAVRRAWRQPASVALSSLTS